MSSTQEILQQVAAGTLNAEEANKKIMALNKAANNNSIRYKVSKKGAISFYGIRRMPITLYIQEISAIVDTIADYKWNDEFAEFIEKNDENLSKKK